MHSVLPAEPVHDGYYLSTYLTEPGLPFLPSSWTRHDNNVSLWRKSGSEVSLVHYWELERFSGIKHHGFGTAGTGQATAMLNVLPADAGRSVLGFAVDGGPDFVTDVTDHAHWYAGGLFLAPPCVNDGGQSLGIALATFAARLKGFTFRFPGACLGSHESDLDAARGTTTVRLPVAYLAGHRVEFTNATRFTAAGPA